VAIGFTFLVRSHWGGAANAELKGLMLDHAFRWARTVWFHVAASNVRSQKAMEKIGAKLSHQGTRQLSGSQLEYFFFRIDRADPWRSSLRGEPPQAEADGSFKPNR
jgi:RimJ/RimL family protein N-acetyltransferase